MAEARSQTSRRWLWAGIVVVLDCRIFHGAILSCATGLPIRVAQVGHALLLNTVSTNGRVEPVVPYPVLQPHRHHGESGVCAGGRPGPGRQAAHHSSTTCRRRAQVASAESGVKTAQAAAGCRHAQRHPGRAAGIRGRDRAGSAGTRPGAARSGCAHKTGLYRRGCTGRSGCGPQRLETAQASLNAAEQSAQHRYSRPPKWRGRRLRWHDAQAALAAARHVEAQTSIYAPIAGTIYTMDAAPSEFAEAGKLLLQMADLQP